MTIKMCDSLHLALQAGALAELAKEREPLALFRWLPGQLDFFLDDWKIKQFRAGNQNLGKTTAVLAECVWTATGTHPFNDEHNNAEGGGRECWVICASWSQSKAIQRKLWDLLPKALLHPDTAFDEARGFRNKEVSVKIMHVPSGEWSVIYFKTTKQDVMDLAGATIDFAAFDELPKTQRVFTEVTKRVLKRAGRVLLAFTPVNAPWSWIPELCESGYISEHHHRLTPEGLIPVGFSTPICLADGTVCDAEFITKYEEDTPAHERDVLVHGEWESKVEGKRFAAWHDLTPEESEGAGLMLPDIPELTLQLQIGIDHGTGTDYSAVAVLVGLSFLPDETGEINKYKPTVYVLDEYVSDGMTTTSMDAAGILKMIRRNDIKWGELDKVYGDRAVYSTATRLQRKSNERLTRELTKKLAVRALSTKIKTVKRGKGHGKGSVYEGIRWLHEAMIEKRFFVLGNCERMRHCLNNWDGGDTEYKHIIDALRYAIDNYIFRDKVVTDYISSRR